MKKYTKFLFMGFLSSVLVIAPVALATSCSSTDYVDSAKYDTTWIGPSFSDLKLNSNDKMFSNDNGQYIAKNWLTIDQSYIDKYGLPKITVVSSDVDAGTMKIKAKFDTVVTLPNGAHPIDATSYTKEITGFNSEPIVKKLFTWKNKKGHNYDVDLASFKGNSLNQQVSTIINTTGHGNNITSSDITSIDYKDESNSNNSDGQITVKITVNFKEPVYLDSLLQPPRQSWDTTGLFTKKYTSTATKFISLRMGDKNQLPSSINEQYAKEHLFGIVDQNGVIMDPSAYVESVKLYPNDAAGYLIMSVEFKTPYSFSKVAPSNDLNNSNYATTEHFWSATFTDMKVNGKPSYNISGYMPDWAQYGGHKLFNMRSMGSKINNYNDYIFSFLNPAVNGDVQFADGWGDYSTNLALDTSSQYKVQKPGNGFNLWQDGDQFLYHYAGKSNPMDHTIDNGGLVGQLMEAKSLYGVRTSASIGGWSYSSNFPLIFSESNLRQHMIDRIIELIQRWGFDNIDLDFEYPGVRRTDSFVHYPPGTPDPSQDKENLLTFVKELRSALDANLDPDVANTTISMAISANPNTINAGIDPDLKNYVDQFNVMTYDLHGSFDEFFGNATSLYSDRELVEAIVDNKSQVTIDNKVYHIDQSYFTSSDRVTLQDEFLGSHDVSVDIAVKTLEKLGIPTEKMNIGMAQYTRGFFVNPSKGSPIAEIPGLFARKVGTETGNWETSGQTAGSSSFASLYSEANDNRNGWTLQTDPVSKAQFYYNEGGTQQWNGQAVNGLVMTVDTPQSVKNKLDYVKNNNLAGVIAWDVSGEWDGSNNYNVLSNEYKQELSNDKNISVDKNVNLVISLKKII